MTPVLYQVCHMPGHSIINSKHKVQHVCLRRTRVVVGFKCQEEPMLS